MRLCSRKTYVRSQGSYLGWPAEALKARMLKPVMFGLGPPWAARSILSARTRRQRWSIGEIGRDAMYLVGSIVPAEQSGAELNGAFSS